MTTQILKLLQHTANVCIYANVRYFIVENNFSYLFFLKHLWKNARLVCSSVNTNYVNFTQPGENKFYRYKQICISCSFINIRNGFIKRQPIFKAQIRQRFITLAAYLCQWAQTQIRLLNQIIDVGRKHPSRKSHQRKKRLLLS